MLTLRANSRQYAVVTLISILVIVFHLSTARELRPSNHGLSFQEDSLPPTQSADGEELQSFFGSASISLPEAKNISDTWMSVHGGSRDHLKVGLVVTSAVCGLTGVVLMIVSGIIFIFRKRKLSAEERVESSSDPASLPHDKH